MILRSEIKELIDEIPNVLKVKMKLLLLTETPTSFSSKRLQGHHVSTETYRFWMS